MLFLLIFLSQTLSTPIHPPSQTNFSLSTQASVVSFQFSTEGNFTYYVQVSSTGRLRARVSSPSAILGELALPMTGMQSLNPSLRCELCPDCSFNSTSLYFYADPIAPNVTVVVSLMEGEEEATGEIVVGFQPTDIWSNTDKVYSVNCGGANLHKFNLELGDTSQTLVLTIRNAALQDDGYELGLLYIRQGDPATREIYDQSMRFHSLGRLSWSSQGPAIGTRLWQNKLGKYLEPGPYYVMIAHDIWRGRYRLGPYPAIATYQGCCQEPLLYTIELELVDDSVGYGWSIVLPWLTFGLPIGAVLLALYWWLNNKHIEYMREAHSGETYNIVSGKAVLNRQIRQSQRPIQPKEKLSSKSRNKTEVEMTGIGGEGEGGGGDSVKASTPLSSPKSPKPKTRAVEIWQTLSQDSIERPHENVYFGRVMNFVAIFVFTPTFQFVYLQALLHRTTGDLCHYNFLCKKDLWLTSYFSLEAFNNLYSNIIFLLVGGAMYLYVIVQSKLRPPNVRNGVKYGIEPNYDIYYAIAIAIAWQGFGSACFHMCPTYWNFQFDTVIMFFISTLLTAAIVTKRDKKGMLTPTSFFLLLAIITIINLIGVYLVNDRTDAPTEKLFHLFIYVPIAVVYALLMIGFVWRCLLQDPVAGMEYKRSGFSYLFVEASLAAFKKWRSFPHFFGVIILFIIQWIIWGICVKNAASTALFFLGSMVMNLVVGGSLYLARKIQLPGERIMPHVWFLWVVFLVTSMLALACFTDYTANNRLDMDASRGMNASCRFLIFDVHDLWHFLSGLALGLLCLFMYHVDDDLINVPSLEIASAWIPDERDRVKVKFTINPDDTNSDPINYDADTNTVLQELMSERQQHSEDLGPEELELSA